MLMGQLLKIATVPRPGYPRLSPCATRGAADVRPWAETCGQIRPLIEEQAEAAAEVHHVEIRDAKLHYHERTDEFYYVIEGRGTMVLDDEEIELHPGVVVYVPRGVKHKAIGKLTVLTVSLGATIFERVRGDHGQPALASNSSHRR